MAKTFLDLMNDANRGNLPPVVVVDTTSVQALTNKTLTAPTLNNATLVAALATGGVVLVPGTTFALTAALHSGAYVVFTSLAGCAVTLPAATGSGARFNLFIGASLTSGSFTVAVANAQDFLRGEAYTFVTTVASTFGTANTGTVATESDTLTFNRTTTGLGTIGDFIELIDIAANVWALEADYASTTPAASPFSAAV